MFRSFPRKRESRVKYAGPSILLWVPAFAGTSGIDVDSIPPDHALVRGLAPSRFGIARKEQRLARDSRHHRGLERLCNQEGRLRTLAGEEALRIRGDKDHRHLERLEQLVHG